LPSLFLEIKLPLPKDSHEFNAGIVNHAFKGVPPIPPALCEQSH
jgi:hypothetical protein